jgi:hypothetical protein
MATIYLIIEHMFVCDYLSFCLEKMFLEAKNDGRFEWEKGARLFNKNGGPFF